MSLTPWIPVLAALAGGLIVAIFNYFITRRKTMAEVKKLEAETERIRSEMSKNIDDAVNYKLAHMEERIIYDGSQGISGYDFEGKEGQMYVDYKSIGPRGQGTLSIDKGIINVQRVNTEGRYELWLRQYTYDGKEKASLPKNDYIAGQRKIRASCEAKVMGGEHTLRFVLKGTEKGKWLANKRARITQNDWTPVDIYFQIPPEADCIFRIDDEDVSRAPSSVQIRNLILAERIA